MDEKNGVSSTKWSLLSKMRTPEVSDRRARDCRSIAARRSSRAIASRSLLESCERARGGVAGLFSGAEQRRCGAVRRDRLRAAAGALVEARRVEPRVREDRCGAGAAVPDREIEVCERRCIVLACLQQARVAELRDRVGVVQCERLL